MKKLLFITPELPYPLQSGGKVKSHKLLHALAERYDVTFASPLKAEDADHLASFHRGSPCTAHHHAALNVPRSARSLATSYLLGRPLNVHRTWSTPLAQRIQEIAHDFDLIVMDHYEVAPYVPRSFKGVRVYHAHNAYHQIWERYAALPGNLAVRAAAMLEARRVRNFEVQVANGADLVFAAPNDADELVAAGAMRDSIRDTYHLGDDRHLDLPTLRFEDTRKKLMYVGFLGWEANANGLLWFIDRVWPTLIDRHPELRFDIVGKGADERLRAAVALHPNIRLLGFVDDLQSLYRESRVSVAPLRFGSGMKVKVLDALARGIPTVTTSVGAEGIEAIDGRHLMIADHAESMAARINQLLEDQQTWNVLQNESRELVRLRYTWQRLFDAMHQEIELALHAHDRSASLPPEELARVG